VQILFLGDSWAVELAKTTSKEKYLAMMAKEKHLAFFLREKGHTVINCGIPGGSNIESLEKAEKYLIDHPTKIDWVVWFHTEFCRDKEKVDYTNMSIDEFREIITNIIYSQYKNFLQSLNCKIAVIGGCADLYPNFYDHIQPDFCIPSWTQEIVGINNTTGVSGSTWIPHMKDSTKNKMAWIESYADTFSAVNASADFPDSAHPGTRPHRDVANRLLKVFDNTD
jgi:hypothetical protein